MKPKTIILIGVAVIILVCVGAYFYFTSAVGGSPMATGTASTTGGEDGTLPAAAQVLTNTPTSTLLALGTPGGTVQVNNFYLSNPSVTDGGETVILANTADYMLTYDTIDSSFWIGIDADKFAAVRPVAEQALLSALGINSSSACKLNVSVGVFYSATSSLSGKSFPLSFCGGLNSVQ
jgi:hypothetical protein